MQVLCLPVSGGGFPVQLGIMRVLCQAGYRPKVTLGASGGNVVAYVCSAADWYPSGIERIAAQLSSDVFFDSWVPQPVLGGLWGFFEGSLYRHGTGVRDLLATYFTDNTIGRDEIWTGTYNAVRRRACFFCNRPKDKVRLKINPIPRDLLQCMPFHYADELEKVVKVCMASASIPSFVPAVAIDDELYSDGGLYYASPLSVIQDALTSEERLHLIYVNSFDLNEEINDGTNHRNLLDNGRQAAADLVRGQIVADRHAGYKLLRGDGTQTVHFRNIIGSVANIKDYLSRIPHCTRSMLELFPGAQQTVNLTEFNGEHILHVMKETAQDCWGRIWWVGSETFFIDLPDETKQGK